MMIFRDDIALVSLGLCGQTQGQGIGGEEEVLTSASFHLSGQIGAFFS